MVGSSRVSHRHGFSLIELVVVLLIIAALAGLAIPLVSMLSRSSDMAVTASAQRELANNVQFFFTVQKRYPQGMDSLVDTTGTLYGPDNTTESLQTKGLPTSSPSLYKDLEVLELDDGATAKDGIDDYLRSLTRGGFDWVYDHDTAALNSNDSATTQRTLGSTKEKLAHLKSGSDAAKKLLPSAAGVIPTGTKVIALGIGPKNSAIGKTINTAPIYPGCDGKYYGRYVAFFQVFSTGERAMLLGVMDSYGRAPDYTIQQFNESMPNGVRQG
jgi:prepilin-type N-terminal cleavage/methylation domain-containing protein